ncbi:hypothetical protein K458DRAFT_383024 [Lentithecium fluviatile CBS 122367]|uniref:Uncharacterized protein n=1 Tax=Lentithecium fluviatile CBS 122367 TaxID=1168545 RepID=A0A6G1JH75_9PLEO|nr:hypothetical protein K458DRAFT_383024 [Lentithecium fluviatile CBS 122367]
MEMNISFSTCSRTMASLWLPHSARAVAAILVCAVAAYIIAQALKYLARTRSEDQNGRPHYVARISSFSLPNNTVVSTFLYRNTAPMLATNARDADHVARTLTTLKQLVCHHHQHHTTRTRLLRIEWHTGIVVLMRAGFAVHSPVLTLPWYGIGTDFTPDFTIPMLVAKPILDFKMLGITIGFRILRDSFKSCFWRPRKIDLPLMKKTEIVQPEEISSELVLKRNDNTNIADYRRSLAAATKILHQAQISHATFLPHFPEAPDYFSHWQYGDSVATIETFEDYIKVRAWTNSDQRKWLHELCHGPLQAGQKEEDVFFEMMQNHMTSLDFRNGSSSSSSATLVDSPETSACGPAYGGSYLHADDSHADAIGYMDAQPKGVAAGGLPTPPGFPSRARGAYAYGISHGQQHQQQHRQPAAAPRQQYATSHSCPTNNQTRAVHPRRYAKPTNAPVPTTRTYKPVTMAGPLDKFLKPADACLGREHYKPRMAGPLDEFPSPVNARLARKLRSENTCLAKQPPVIGVSRGIAQVIAA